MIYLMAIAALGVIVLQASGAIPQSSVGGPMAIAMAFITAAFAVGIHEAWTMRRGAIGWVVNIVVSFVGAFFGAQLAGAVIVPIVYMFGDVQGSIASAGGGTLAFALAAGVVIAMLGAWAALQLLNQWRKRA